MPKDVVVVVNIDAKPTGTESLDILLVSTEGAADCKVYRDLDVINKDFPNKKVAAMAAAMFDQGKTTLAETLIRKIKIVGVATPETSAALVKSIEDPSPPRRSWALEPKTIASFISGRPRTRNWLSRTGGPPSSTPTQRRNMQTRPMSETWARSTLRASHGSLSGPRGSLSPTSPTQSARRWRRQT